MGSEFELQRPGIANPGENADTPTVPQLAVPTENPPWSGWDTIYILLVTLPMIFVSLRLVAYLVRRVGYPSLPVLTVMTCPMVAFGAQMLAYLVVLGFMFTTATKTGRPFGEAIRWSWPQKWAVFLLIGVVFCLGLQVLAHV